MGKFYKINAKEIEDVLSHVSRQYLVGNLSRPQELEFFRDTNLEIGITDYDSYATEPAHRHSQATEYQYMLSGWTQYMDTDTGEVAEYKKGDFYVITKNTSYAQKSKKGTRILFIKVPSINDKEIVTVGQEVSEWLQKRLETVRKDYYHAENAPKANSMVPAAAVAILNKKSEILMLQRKDNGKWTMPGGTMELDESLTGCALREVKEECGLDVSIVDVIGTYTDPDIRVEYSDGEVRREFTVLYFGHLESDEDSVVLDAESTKWQWIPLDEVESVQMTNSQRIRIKDVVKYLQNGAKHFT